MEIMAMWLVALMVVVVVNCLTIRNLEYCFDRMQDHLETSLREVFWLKKRVRQLEDCKEDKVDLSNAACDEDREED